MGMGRVKEKVAYLTERSTPYQTRTIEAQRAIQGAVASLTKAGASRDMAEYKIAKGEAEKALQEVKAAFDTLKKLSSSTDTERLQRNGRLWPRRSSRPRKEGSRRSTQRFRPTRTPPRR